MITAQVAKVVKNLPIDAMQETQETRVRSLGQEDPLGEGDGNPLGCFLPGEFHGQRSLAGYSPWGRKESDTTEHAHTCTYFYELE